MLTDDDFYKKYTPEYNQILLEELRSKEDTGSILPEDMCSFGGCMYETYGKELDYVRTHPCNRIWTIIECHDDENDEPITIISAGYHFINRFGYLITNEPWTDSTEEFICE
jgi:hypothetical protein